MPRTAYDGEGRKYYVEEPLLQPRGPVQTTNADGNLPFTGGFNRGVRRGVFRRRGLLFYRLCSRDLILFGCRASRRPRAPLVSSSLDSNFRPHKQSDAQFGHLLKGLASVVLWLPFYGILIGLPASFASVVFPALRNCSPIASVLYFCSLTGAFFEALTGDV